MHNNLQGVFLDGDARPRFPDGARVIAAAPVARDGDGPAREVVDLSWGRRTVDAPQETREAQ